MLPLGLGLNIPRFPFVTVLLILANVFFYTQHNLNQKKLIEYYEEAKNTGKKEKLFAFHKQNKLLTKNNITFAALNKAQFNHAGLLHIFSNMLFLFMIGIYVEAKVGALLYLLIYFLGGYLGMGLGAYFSSDELVYFVGASANVYGIIGGFFILFYRHYMKYLWLSIIPPGARTVLLPVRYCIPAFMLALEVLSYINATVNNVTTGVAHLGHIGGFAGGFLIAYLYKKTDPIKHPFFYPKEEEIFKEMQKTKKLEVINSFAKRINNYNPMNYVVRIYVIEKAIEQLYKDEYVSPNIHKAFQDNLEPILGRLVWKKDYHAAQSLLQEIPFIFKLHEYIKGLSQRQILHLGDYLLEKKDYINALRCYHLFLSQYKNMKVEPDLLKTCDSIFKKHIDNPQDVENIRLLITADENNIMYHRYAIDRNKSEESV